jgi:hypothetical protein
MSLTSRVANLFVSESTTSRNDIDALNLTNNGHRGSREEGFTDVGFEPGPAEFTAMASEKFEEESRPKYIHVRQRFIAFATEY